MTRPWRLAHRSSPEGQARRRPPGMMQNNRKKEPCPRPSSSPLHPDSPLGRKSSVLDAKITRDLVYVIGETSRNWAVQNILHNSVRWVMRPGTGRCSGGSLRYWRLTDAIAGGISVPCRSRGLGHCPCKDCNCRAAWHGYPPSGGFCALIITCFPSQPGCRGHDCTAPQACF